jgi:hypothetical protein
MTRKDVVNGFRRLLCMIVLKMTLLVTDGIKAHFVTHCRTPTIKLQQSSQACAVKVQ